MTYQPNLKPESNALLEARKWAVGIIASLFALDIFISELHRIRETLSNPLTIGYLILFISCVCLIFIWIWATEKELDICFTWLDPERYLPPSSFKETLMIIGLGLLLVIMFFATRNPLWFGIIFSFYSFIVTFTNQYSKNQISKAVDESRMHLKKENEIVQELSIEYLKGIDIIETYYNKRPQLQRHLVIDVTCILGLTFGILWKISNNELFGEIAYIIFILTILLSEIIIAFWRINRDNKLREIKEEINFITRTKDIAVKSGLTSKRRSK